MDAPKFDLADAYALKRMQAGGSQKPAAEAEPAETVEAKSEQPEGHEQAAQAMLDAVSANDVNALAACIKSLMER